MPIKYLAKCLEFAVFLAIFLTCLLSALAPASNSVAQVPDRIVDADHPICSQLLNGLNVAGFHEFLAIKESLQESSEFKELDNRNLAGTFYSLLHPPTQFQKFSSPAEIKQHLLEIFDIPKPLQPNLTTGKGVRQILADLLNFYHDQGYSAVLPDDIYPVYGVLAHSIQMSARNYSSVPTLTIPDSKSSSPELLVITSPLSPLGRSLMANEIQLLKKWLAGDSRRRLILDTVYTFSNHWDQVTEELLKSPQVVAVHSFAKSWVIPGYLGFAASLAPEFSSFGKMTGGPDLDLASKAIAIVKTQPTLPEQLSHTFREQWQKISPIIKSIDPNWSAPENGYLTVVSPGARQILTDHGYWTMPLSTFGSRRQDLSVVSALPDSQEEVYYATTLSNLARGYNKYSGKYEKAGISESTFPDKFFLLTKSELFIGIKKAKAILTKTGPGDRVIVIKTSALSSRLLPNERTGLGRYVPRNSILVSQLYYLIDQELEPVRLEDALADSYALNRDKFVPFENIRPRSISILPVANACQACCKFCFSDGSASAERRKKTLSNEAIEKALITSKSRGAERAVITGGGEPTLIGFDKLAKMIALTSRYFPNKITLITNGVLLARLSEEDRLKRLLEMDHAGLSVLAISRHHYDSWVNAQIMGIDTGTEKIAETISKNKSLFRNLKLRFICVLQKAGVGTEQEIINYINWAQSVGVSEINFKELYVSTDRESSYYLSAANVFSENNRIFLRTVLNVARKEGWMQVSQLPWGAPVFQKDLSGTTMQIAAYTEPSLFWERTNGIARSWNLMADGKLLVSLETGDSEIEYGD